MRDNSSDRLIARSLQARVKARRLGAWSHELAAWCGQIQESLAATRERSDDGLADLALRRGAIDELRTSRQAPSPLPEASPCRPLRLNEADCEAALRPGRDGG